MLLLKNCHLVKGLVEGVALDYADVLVDGQKIAAIEPVGTTFPGEHETIDLKNKTLLPGLFDLHCHLMFVSQDWGGMLLRETGEYIFDCCEYAQIYLDHGYTTVRDCGCQNYSSVSVRDAVNKGTMQGPRIFSAGEIITPTTKGNRSFGVLYAEIDKAEDLAKECRVQRSHGVDFIKYMVTGAVLNDGGEPGAIITTPEELEAIVRAAKDLGTYVAGHCHGKEGIKQAVLAGFHTIEHASYLDQECIDLILEKGNKTALVPTLSIGASLAKSLIGNVETQFVEKAKAAVAQTKKSMKLAHEQGICIGFGTDNDQGTFTKFYGLEFTERLDAGLSNLDILKQATINSAKILGIDQVTGSIKVGKCADLIVMEGNPEEDLHVMCEKPVHVIKEGQWIR